MAKRACYIGPLALWFGLKLRRVDHDVFDMRAFPGVSRMNEAVARLNDRGIAKTLVLFLLQFAYALPRLAVRRDRQVQHPASPPAGIADAEVIVDQKVTSIGK